MTCDPRTGSKRRPRFSGDEVGALCLFERFVILPLYSRDCVILCRGFLFDPKTTITAAFVVVVSALERIPELNSDGRIRDEFSELQSV